MNYIAEINAFNDWCERNYLPMSAQFLWYKLMAKNNRLGWCEWVQVDNLELMSILGIKREASAVEIRNKLVESGIVKFRKGKKGCPNQYKMVSLSNLQVNTEVKSVVNTEVNTEVQTVDYNKLKQNKTKDILSKQENLPKSQKHKYGEYQRIFLTDEQHEKLVSEYGDKNISEYISKMDEWIQTKGKSPYKDYNLAIRQWLKRDGINKKEDSEADEHNSRLYEGLL